MEIFETENRLPATVGSHQNSLRWPLLYCKPFGTLNLCTVHRVAGSPKKLYTESLTLICILVNDTQNRFADTNISANKKQKSKKFHIFYKGLLRSRFIKIYINHLAAMPLNIYYENSTYKPVSSQSYSRVQNVNFFQICSLQIETSLGHGCPASSTLGQISEPCHKYLFLYAGKYSFSRPKTVKYHSRETRTQIWNRSDAATRI